MSLETGALKVGWGPQHLRHSAQRDIDGNPASGNHSCMQLPTDTITLKEFSGKYSSDPVLTNTQTQNLQRVTLMLEQHLNYTLVHQHFLNVII